MANEIEIISKEKAKARFGVDGPIGILADIEKELWTHLLVDEDSITNQDVQKYYDVTGGHFITTEQEDTLSENIRQYVLRQWFLDVVPPESLKCICDIDVVMNVGCQCGGA